MSKQTKTRRVSRVIMQASREKKEWKGKIGGDWSARRNVQLERDGRLVVDVNRWKVTTRELGAALLDLPRTPANLKIVESRYRQLAKHDFNQVSIDSTTYNVTLALGMKSKLERAQIQHRYMEALVASTMLRAGGVQEYLSGGEIRERIFTGKLKDIGLEPDSFFRFETSFNRSIGVFWENETGKSDYYTIIPRSLRYFDQRALLKSEYKVDDFVVVWNCRILSWVKDIAQDIQTKLPLEAHELFFVAAEKQIDPFTPMSMFDKHYVSPVNLQLYNFWGE